MLASGRTPDKCAAADEDGGRYAEESKQYRFAYTEEKQKQSRAQVALFAEAWLSSAQYRVERPDQPPPTPSHLRAMPMEGGPPLDLKVPVHASVALARAVVSVSAAPFCDRHNHFDSNFKTFIFQ